MRLAMWLGALFGSPLKELKCLFYTPFRLMYKSIHRNVFQYVSDIMHVCRQSVPYCLAVPFFLMVHAFIYGSIIFILLKVNRFLASNKNVGFLFSQSFWPNKRSTETAKYYKWWTVQLNKWNKRAHWHIYSLDIFY